MQIGKYNVHLIDTGRFRLDGGSMFGVVPQSLWKKQNAPDEKNRIKMALNTLLITGGNRNILIDTGIGEKGNEKFNTIYAVDHSRYNLKTALAQHNLQPEDITDVILTHLHFDHVGGATYLDNDTAFRLTFPNASHYVQKKQWKWALKGFEKDRASYLTENLEPLMQSGKLHLLEGEQQLFDDISLILTDGHTVSQQLVFISGNGTKLLHAADMIPMTAHIPLPWVMAYDLYPVTTIEEKRRLLPQAAEEEWLIFFEHDPRICCGTILQDEHGFRLKEAVQL
ncbi:MAG: MBL fold metallo-hydrolase [Calditrichia bacterium]